MGLSARLVVYGHVGTVAQPPQHISLTAQNIVDAAKRRPGALQNVRSIRKDDEGTGATIIAPTLVFPAVANRRDAWGSANGNNQYDEAALGDSYSIVWSGNGVPSLLISDPAKYRIGTNEAFTISGFVYKPNGEFPIWTARWNGWQFQIKKGRAYVMKLAPAWNQALENAYNGLLALPEEESTTEVNDAINSAQAELYTIHESLSIEPGGGDGWYGQPWKLTFYAEPRGALSVFLGEDARWQEQTIEVPDILKTRTAGTVWGSGPLTLASSEGTWAVQVGYPSHAVQGRIYLGSYRHPASQDWQTAAKSMIADKPTGTNITIDIEDEPGVGLEGGTEYTNSKIYATLTTTNPRLTPFLYAVDVNVDPEPLGEFGDVNFDSNDLEDDDGPIMEIQPQFEGDMRRSQYLVESRDINGRTFASIKNRNEGLANRYCRLYIGGTTVVALGIVKESQISNAAKATENILGDAALNPDSRLNLVICDLWALLEETLLTEGAIIGDGLKLGALIRRVLAYVGFNSAQLAGVSASAGVRLSSAAIGETYAHASSDGQSAADFLREKLDRYGMGWVLYQNSATGVWTFAVRSNALAQIGGSDATFLTGPGHSPTTYPGRRAVLKPLDFLRSTDEFYNAFRVVGAMGPDGKRIVHDEVLWESVTATVAGIGNTQSRYFIGRMKRYPTVVDDSIRTQSEAALVGRSLRLRYGRPPRYHSYESYYHVGLFPGDKTSLDGLEAVNERYSGSIKSDRSQISEREVA
jgi:hypothetical protein